MGVHRELHLESVAGHEVLIGGDGKRSRAASWNAAEPSV